MSDNVTIKDASGNSKTMRSIDTTGADLHVPVHRLDALALSGPTAQSVLNADLLTGTINGWYEVKDFASAVIQIIGGAGITAGAVIFEQTNDATNTTGIALEADELGVINANPNIAAITIAASTRRMFAMAITSRYIRARISTAFTGGTVQAVAQLMTQTLALATVNVQQATAASLATTVSGTVTANAGTGNFTIIQATAASLNAQVVGPGASGAAVSGNPVRIAGSDGTNTQNIKTDTSGNLVVVQPTAANLQATVTGTVVANAGTGSFTVAQATAANLNATVTGTVAVTQATAANLQATVSQATAANLNATVVGTVAVTQATAANLNATVVGTVAVTQATAANLNATVLQATPTTGFYNSAATTNATSVKTSAGTVYGVTVSNINAAARFLKLYNLAVAPTVGTSVPVLTIPIPAASVVNVPLGTIGARFTTGIAFAITAAAADADTTVVAANEIKVGINYL
ncbi:hypothetical protein UFOVP233_54 [uncultured Caudovirales phage]|uniref:Uncharacterized protein n=1 Tax=uncultured Caudovirales phage TaxID=2100421 RepID=A0A6J7WRD8_9CAUD|nr:hypothetical protein UFOVP233_54 [uncultured Caudovirales phage]